MATIFIDGQAGTTGIEIATRLRAREDLTLLTIAEDERKDPAAREKLFQQGRCSYFVLARRRCHKRL